MFEFSTQGLCSAFSMLRNAQLRKKTENAQKSAMGKNQSHLLRKWITYFQRSSG